MSGDDEDATRRALAERPENERRRAAVASKSSQPSGSVLEGSGHSPATIGITDTCGHCRYITVTDAEPS